MPYWKKPIQQPFFSQPWRGNVKQAPTITPHPEIITKIMDDRGNLQSNKPQQGGSNVFEKPKKEKKKPIPGIRLLKKLVHHKDPGADEKKLKRIVYAIKKHIDDEYDYK
jgi:hypothetical protein